MHHFTSSTSFGIVLLLAIIAAVPTALALFKLQPESGKLVTNAKPGMVYLFQFPRTSTTPSQAALNLKVETWLKWANIPFYRLSNQFFLGSQTAGAAPFALYNGEFYDGSDTIIEKLGAKFGKYQPNAEEKRLRRKFDDQLFKFLMADRATRSSGDVGGLDWELSDEGIAQQIVPLLVNSNAKFSVKLSDGIEYQIQLNSSSLNAYFNAYIYANAKEKVYDADGKCAPNTCNKCSEENDPKACRHCRMYQEGCQPAKIHFLKQFLTMPNGTAEDAKQFRFEDWLVFSKAIRSGVIVPALQAVFKEKQGGASSSEAKLDQLLEENIYVGADCQNFNYSKFKGNGEEMLDELLYILRPIVRNMRNDTIPEKSMFPANNNELTPTHASLFGALIQYFETPLNNEVVRKYFQPNKQAEPMEEEEKDVKVLRDFVLQVKKSLDLNLQWNELTKKPWKLNYEKIGPAEEEDNNVLAKFDGPFAVDNDVDQLEQIVELIDGANGINETMLAKYPKLVQAIVPKLISEYLENYWSIKVGEEQVKKEAITHRLKKFMLQAMSAYICQGNSVNSKGKQVPCAAKHFENIRQQYPAQYITAYVPQLREIIYPTIVEYNEGIVKQNVLAAVAAARAAGAVSDTKIGNEQ